MNKGLQRCLLASMRGFEPPTPRSIQLSYMDICKIIQLFASFGLEPSTA